MNMPLYIPGATTLNKMQKSPYLPPYSSNMEQRPQANKSGIMDSKPVMDKLSEMAMRYLKRSTHLAYLLNTLSADRGRQSTLLPSDERYVVELNAPHQLAESRRLEQKNKPHLAIFDKPEVPQDITDRVKDKSAKDNPYAYNPRYKKLLNSISEYFRKLRQGSQQPKLRIYNAPKENMEGGIAGESNNSSDSQEEKTLEQRLVA